MKILFLAPQPFFQDRGTPIAVRLALTVISGREQNKIDLVTYHEGTDIEIKNVNQVRIKAPACLKGIRPGISVKKLFCDFFFLITILQLLWKNRKDQYRLIHAVEESAFIAILAKCFLKIPYVYDMDSSLAMQLTESWKILHPLQPILNLMESLAIKHSEAVVPVCDALAVIANRHGSQDTQILRDISLLGFDDNQTENPNIREESQIPAEAKVLLYIGNLEKYQGIDLLIDGFSLTAPETHNFHVVIIGGSDEHIELYKEKVRSLNLTDKVHLIGRRPVALLNCYLSQADSLASPRTKGNNTPMKVYSYLHSGKVIIATRLPTHTQVLDDTVAVLAESDNQSFADAMKAIFQDEALRDRIGTEAVKLAEEKYTFEIFSRDLNSLYDRLTARIN